MCVLLHTSWFQSSDAPARVEARRAGRPPSPGRTAPRRARPRASTAGAPARPAPRARAARRRARRRRRRCGRSSPGPSTWITRTLLGVEAERLRERGAQHRHALAVRPDRELAVRPLLRERGRRTDRRVHLVRPRVASPRACRAAPGGAAIGSDRRSTATPSTTRKALARLREQLARAAASCPGSVSVSSQRARDAQRSARPHRLLLALRDDADEAAVAHDRAHAGHGAHRRVVERLEPRARARRAQHAPVEQPGRREVLDERAAPVTMRARGRCAGRGLPTMR